jgi:signal transduction histidine kinase
MFRRSLLDTRTIRVLDEASSAPLLVEADPAALEQVLINLLDNAVRYSQATKEIVVRVGRLRSLACIDVVDQGSGIESSDHGRVFERFYRGAGAPLNRDGFGLGLAIARQIITDHGGTLVVDSVLGAGSTFSVRLPALRATEQPSNVSVV